MSVPPRDRGIRTYRSTQGKNVSLGPSEGPTVCRACNVISPVLVLHARHAWRRKALRLRRRRQRRPTSAILAPRASFLLARQEVVRRRRIPWAAVQAHELAALIQHELLRSTLVACDAKPAVFVAKVVRHGGWRSAAVSGGKCFASHVVVDVGLRNTTPRVRGSSSFGVALTPRGDCCIELAVVALPRFRFAAPFIKDGGPIVTEARCFLAFVRSTSSAGCRHRGALRRARGAVVSSQVLRLVDVPRAGGINRRRRDCPSHHHSVLQKDLSSPVSKAFLGKFFQDLIDFNDIHDNFDTLHC